MKHIVDRDLKKIEFFFENKHNKDLVKYRDNVGFTPLILASSVGCLECVELILRKSKPYNVDIVMDVDLDGNTAIMVAAKEIKNENHMDVVIELLKHMNDLSHVNVEGESFLTILLDLEPDIANILLNKKSFNEKKLTNCESEGVSPLTLAVRKYPMVNENAIKNILNNCDDPSYMVNLDGRDNIDLFLEKELPTDLIKYILLKSDSLFLTLKLSVAVITNRSSPQFRCSCSLIILRFLRGLMLISRVIWRRV